MKTPTTKLPPLLVLPEVAGMANNKLAFEFDRFTTPPLPPDPNGFEPGGYIMSQDDKGTRFAFLLRMAWEPEEADHAAQVALASPNPPAVFAKDVATQVAQAAAKYGNAIRSAVGKVPVKVEMSLFTDANEGMRWNATSPEIALDVKVCVHVQAPGWRFRLPVAGEADFGHLWDSRLLVRRELWTAHP